MTTEARSLTNLLDDIQDKYDKIPLYKRQQLVDAYDPCVGVLLELDKLLIHYTSLNTKSKRAWDRLKWDPEQSRSLRERLASSVAMLNAFYTSLIHDNQVLILEALERLEGDYKGGHREESIASIELITSNTSQQEEDNSDAAWAQIIRDLEDVGISHEVAVTYHDFVIDWFIKAVNEGRLLEDRKESESFDSTRPSSSLALDMESMSTSLAVTSLSDKSDLPPIESWSKSLPDIVPLHRSDSSNAPEPLHISVPFADVHKELHLPNAFTSAPEPVQVLSPSTRADEAFPVSYQRNLPVQPAIFTTEGLECVQPLASFDISQRAQQILSAWTKREFAAAAKLLEDELAAVEQGFVAPSGLQPDRRILRHFVGVCASFSGDLTKAKYFFESAFNGIYLSKNLDDGDIAAARWLGDTCLQLREFHNAQLAWSVALEGSIRRYGSSHESTRHIAQEMYKMDEWTWAFSKINDQFLANVDPTDIFSNAHAFEKSDLVQAIQAYIHELQPRWSQNRSHRPTSQLRARSRVDLVPGEGFLTGPLVSLGAWPLQWDSTFSPMGVYQMEWHMNIAPPSIALVKRSLRTYSLGDSKKLDYVTRNNSTWLIETVKAILSELGVEHAEHPDENTIVCCLDKDREGFAFSEGIFISFWKLQFRHVYGLKVSDARWSTRHPPLVKKTGPSTDFGSPDVTAELRNTLKEMLELAGAGASINTKAPTNDGASVPSSIRSWTPWAALKRP